jgi:signal transduction histidine kinase
VHSKTEARHFPLGRAGVLVLHGGRLDSQNESSLRSLTPILRRPAAEERLARTLIQLARRNQALEDFGALVARELKTPLQAALLADDPSSPVEDAQNDDSVGLAEVDRYAAGSGLGLFLSRRIAGRFGGVPSWPRAPPAARATLEFAEAQP